MKSASLLKNTLIILAITVVSFALYTLLPNFFPHPEDFSPYVYVAAILVLVMVWLVFPKGRRKWFYLPVLLLCLLALLDETGYGSEVMDIQPYYSQTYHVEIKDLHNAIGLGIELTQEWLIKKHWEGGLFVAFLAFDAILVAAGFLFAWLLRWRQADGEAGWRRRALWLGAGGILLAGLIAVGYLFSLPPDPKDAWLLGYSLIRMASMFLLLVLSASPLILLVDNRKRKNWLATIEAGLTSIWGRLLARALVLVLLAGLAYQLYAPFVFLPDGRARLERFTPLVLWAVAAATFLGLAWLAWNGCFRRSVTWVLLDQLAFLRREPAYYYAGWAVFLILVAQLIDRGFIPLNTWIQTPNFHVQLWGLWTEETFEMVAGFLFLTASLFITDTPDPT